MANAAGVNSLFKEKLTLTPLRPKLSLISLKTEHFFHGSFPL